MPQSAFREVKLRDGRTLAYAEYGSPSGKPIIHCHGVPSSRVEADLTLNGEMAATLGLRLIVPDRPGMGGSDFQANRTILDWPNDVVELADALGLSTFAVLGSSGGAPYACACGVKIPQRVRGVGIMGGVAPMDQDNVAQSMHGGMRFMFRVARYTPPLLRGMFRLNLRMIRSGGEKAGDRMASMAPEPDKTLLQRPEIAKGFVACFVEACRQGVRGPAFDMGLIARPWGFSVSDLKVPVLLWHGEHDRNVPVAHGRYYAGAIPGCRATFYPEDAHLSVPINHQEDILRGIASL